MIHRAKRNESTLASKDMINISSKSFYLFHKYTLVNVHVGGLCFISVWAVGVTPRWASNLPRGAVKITYISPLGGSQNSDLFLCRKSKASTLFLTFYPLFLHAWMFYAPVGHLGSFYVDYVKWSSRFPYVKLNAFIGSRLVIEISLVAPQILHIRILRKMD